MSDMVFPFGVAGDAGEPEGGSNRTKLFVGAGAGLVLVLLVVFVLLPMLSGGDDSTATPLGVKRPAAAAKGKSKAPAVQAKPAAKPPTVIPPTYNDIVGRDPFKALWVKPAPAAPTGTGFNAAPSTGGAAQVGGQRVALLDVYAKDGKTFAQTKVGDTVYTTPVGSVFATNYKVLSASGSCGSFLYGDEAFTLCEGQEILK